MYIDICSSCSGESVAGARKGWISSAVRVVSMRLEIVDGGEEILNRRVRGGFAENAENAVGSRGNLASTGGWAQLEMSFGYLREWGKGW